MHQPPHPSSASPYRAVDPAPVRPSRWWYAAAPFAFLLGLAAAVVLALSVAGDIPGTGLDTFTAPGHVDLELAEGDEQTIYVLTAEGGAPMPVPSGFRCSVHGATSDDPVLEPNRNTTVTLGNLEYAARYDFTANERARYRISCRARGGQSTVAVGPKLGIFELVGKVFAAIAAFFAGIVVAALIAIIVALMRRSSRRRLQQGPAPGHGGTVL